MKVSTYVILALAVLAAMTTLPVADARGADDHGVGWINEAGRALRDAYYSNVDAEDPERVWEENWPIWSARLRGPQLAYSSVPLIVGRDCEGYHGIIGLGPRAVPFIVRQFRREHEANVRAMLTLAWQDTSGFVSVPDANPWYMTTLEQWWEGGQALTDERFAEAYAEDDLEAIRWLGAAALPRVMEKLEAGDYRMLDVVERRTLGRADVEGETPDERAAACLAWWEENKQYWLIPFPDREPLQEDEEGELEG